ncbi:MAG: urease accessory protein UreE [Rhodospirillaceae bacterium]|jgi:urease accessory protein|nr:urease accessory protein UreE [Rhodospirillaceae bacterium]MBT5665606.1 urease accessory protein UreE [Rhodospirillaceae bacterium]MBT5810044.1 urease accessory protein UreE [Rhodospirillaceae bacterium]
MLRAHDIQTAGNWTGPAADTVVLDFNDRHRRRLAMTGVNGMAFLLDLPATAALKDGDGLMLEDGRVVAVQAASETLMEITCRDAAHLVQIAWHLGNRHLPTELFRDRLRIRQDHVIRDMLVQLGATVTDIQAPFNPEGGAYGHGRTHGHDHEHSHHGHSHG